MGEEVSYDKFQGKTVLVTGGTGSFGNSVIRRLLGQTNQVDLRVFSRDEKKQDDMRRHYDSSNIKFYVGDVRDLDSIKAAMDGVDYVFHAAALKQVPSCEFFPMQAIMTNVLGSENVIRAASEASVKNVVMLSTDKAVMPVNAMGMSKALMEKVAQAEMRRFDEPSTTVSCVRYGNVMYSRGSVIPLFVEQIQNGQDLTITDEHMTRFMLPLESAVDLVLFALVNSGPGDIFVKKAPGATVGNLARALKEIFSSDVGIKTIGIRHGEKIHEALASAEELNRSEDLGGYLRIQMDDRDINYNKYFNEGDEVSLDDYTSGNTDQLDVPQVKDLLLSLPEIQSHIQGV